MRSIKELFIIVRDNLYLIQEDDSGLSGICGVIFYLKNTNLISIDEAKVLQKYMDTNRPIWPSIYADPYRGDNSLWWWTINYIKPRRRWLNHIIRKLEREEQKSLNNSAKQILDNSKFGKL